MNRSKVANIQAEALSSCGPRSRRPRQLRLQVRNGPAVNVQAGNGPATKLAAGTQASRNHRTRTPVRPRFGTRSQVCMMRRCCSSPGWPFMVPDMRSTTNAMWTDLIFGILSWSLGAARDALPKLKRDELATLLEQNQKRLSRRRCGGTAPSRAPGPEVRKISNIHCKRPARVVPAACSHCIQSTQVTYFCAIP